MISAHTLSCAIFELLSNPATLERAKAELKSAISDPSGLITFAELDGLPYFNAIYQETIRLHPGVVCRQWRESPEPMVYKDQERGVEYTIPADFGYSMTPLILHHDPAVFENPLQFDPQRWIDNPKLSRAFMGFSRGPRACIG
jgi:cytochrome P450